MSATVVCFHLLAAGAQSSTLSFGRKTKMLNDIRLNGDRRDVMILVGETVMVAAGQEHQPIILIISYQLSLFSRYPGLARLIRNTG